MKYLSVLKKMICLNYRSIGTIEYDGFNKYLDCPEYKCKKCGEIAIELYVEPIR